MSNLATVTPIKPHLEVVESIVADLDDGYTRTANALLEAVMLSGLTQHQLLIVMAVWRKTYGYNKKMDWIGNDQFAELTGMASTKCSTAKNELIRMGVLTQAGRQVGMNKNISEWKTKVNGFGKTFTESVKLTFPKSVKCSLPKRSNTKDNNTKDKKERSPIPPEGDFEGAQKALEYYNQLTNSSCRSAEPYLRIMTATKGRKAYTLQDVCLVTKWVIATWHRKGKTLPKPHNICRVNSFDGYLSDAEKWQREAVDIDCQKVIDVYNEVTAGRMPFAELYRDREIAIRELATHLAKKNVEGFRNYFKAFMASARDFYFGGPDGSGWCASFDTLMDVKTLRKVKEGSL